MTDAEIAAFRARLNGTFVGMVQWRQLDQLWARVKDGSWYVYQLGETVPVEPSSGEALVARIDALDALLRQEHNYDYCGIVYVDDVELPSLIKVYDPNHLGSSCSHNATPTPPGWILSAQPPAALLPAAPPTNSRKSWWQRFLN